MNNLKRNSFSWRSVLSLLLMFIAGNTWAANEVTYTVSARDAVDTTGTAPEGSSVTLGGTGTLNSGTIQMTSGNTAVLTLSGFEGYKITGIKLAVKSNKSGGAGSFTAVAGSTTIASIAGSTFNSSSWNGSYSTSMVYKTVTMTDDSYVVQDNENVVLTITASANSLYVGNWIITYVAADEKEAAKTPALTDEAMFTTSAMDVTITNKESGATVYYTTDGTAPTTASSSFTGESKTIEVSGTTTVKAMAVIDGKENSSVASATYTYEKSIANTAATAYTTTEAIALIDANSSQLTTTEVYVKGTISKIGSKTSSGQLTYYLDNDAFEIYNGLNKDGAEFSATTDLQVGDEIIVKGLIKKYSTSTYEMDKNNVLIERTTAATQILPTLTIGTYKSAMTVGDAADSYEITYDGDGELSATSGNTDVATVSVSGTTVTVTPVSAGKATITVSASETNSYYAATKSYTLTVSAPQEAASIPFTFDGGYPDVLDATCMKQTGLGSDYSASPKLRFDDTNDNLIIKYEGSAKYLQFSIKGNSFNLSTFDVLESADGATYTSVKSYTALGATEPSQILCLKDDSRYVKFIYTNKYKGNVAIGAISIANYYTGSLNAMGYATFSSAQDVEITGAEVYTAELSGTTITCHKVEGNKVPAYTGVILYGDASAKYYANYADEADEITVDNSLLPTTTSTGTAAKVSSLVLSGDTFVTFSGDAFSAGKAYFPYTAGAKSFNIVFDDAEATGISEINNEESRMKSDIRYNLAGQRIANLQKGINIINGKKYIVK